MITKNTLTDTIKNPIVVPNIPAGDLDLRDMSTSVNNLWSLNPQIKIIWVDQHDFELLVNNYSTTLKAIKTTGSSRPEFTRKLENIDAAIDTDIENVKRYLVEKYTKAEAPSYFSEFGIIKVHKMYKLPINHKDRKAALELLIPALTVRGIQNNAFGLAYWTNIQSKFNSLLQATEKIDGLVSKKVGDKNILKKQIRKVLNSLIKIIIGNYPDDYKIMLRNWGFQRRNING